MTAFTRADLIRVLCLIDCPFHCAAYLSLVRASNHLQVSLAGRTPTFVSKIKINSGEPGSKPGLGAFFLI